MPTKELQKFLKPAPQPEGSPPLIVRDPRSMRPLPADGAYVPWAGSGLARYWRRQYKHGSVIEAIPPKPKVEKPAAKGKEDSK